MIKLRSLFFARCFVVIALVFSLVIEAQNSFGQNVASENKPANSPAPQSVHRFQGEIKVHSTVLLVQGQPGLQLHVQTPADEISRIRLGKLAPQF